MKYLFILLMMISVCSYGQIKVTKTSDSTLSVLISFDSLTKRIDSLQTLCDSLAFHNDKLLLIIRELIEIQALRSHVLDGIEFRYSLIKPKKN
jgi:hypothetical protein